jgi:acetoin utilization deacetylase AcuC-like enzyme
MVVITDPSCVEYELAGHPESPQRVARTVRLLQTQVELPIRWESPVAVSEEALLRAHEAAHLKRLAQVKDFDGDTLWFAGLPEHARRAVGGALAALDHAMAGRKAFSLMRPPGHHATRTDAMGFCYLGNAAVAALEARARGVNRVAIYDFDVHHGNGTEAIVQGVEGISFHSVHQYPAYPGTGVGSGGNCHNYPVAPHTSAEAWAETLREAWEDLCAGKPDLVILSAGFDAYRGDPLAQQELEEADFLFLGRMIHSANVSTMAVLEGGYSRELPALILAFLVGWEEG